eukprot:scaffold1383_cov360-Prasinococcus_capsulatus_cf.AAC.10
MTRSRAPGALPELGLQKPVRHQKQEKEEHQHDSSATSELQALLQAAPLLKELLTSVILVERTT